QEESREARLARADEELAAGQYAKAETDYREILRAAPNDPQAVRQLGLLYHEQGQVVQALPLLKKSAELEPNHADVQLRLGEIYLAGRQYSQARDAAQFVLAKQPAQEQALLLLADASVAAEEIEETRKQVESLRGNDQDRPGYHLALGALA